MSTAAGHSAPAPNKPRFFVLGQYFLRNGTQAARLHDYLQATLPVAAKIQPGPRICLESLVAPHMPQVATISGTDSADEWQTASRRMLDDTGYRKAFATWESGPEPPYEHYSQVLLRAMPYSPAIEPLAERPKTPRVFELRTYHSPTWRQLHALHERFAGPEIRIFQRVGVHPVLYSETVFGPNMPNLTYLIPFSGLAAREKAWSAFSADPEWIKVRKESIDAHGQISSVMQISLYRATAYSPIA